MSGVDQMIDQRDKDTLNPYKFIDLFAGIGGFRIALELAGGKCIFSSEIDKAAQQTYQNNFGKKPHGDITQIEAHDIPNHDILIGGFPCQAFSIAGKRQGFEDTRGTLFFEVARILKEKQPKAFILENVRGLVSHNKGKTLKTIMEVLDSVGYTANYRCLNAKNYGVPQNRDRWYCIGFRKDLNVYFDDHQVNAYQFPKARPLTTTLKDIIETKPLTQYGMSQTASSHMKNHYKLKGLYPSEDQYTLAYEIRRSRCSFSQHQYSPCLTAKMGTGGNNIPVIFELERKLTERECLRIMGFPKWFQIEPLKQSSYKQIGNSVAIPVVEQLAKELIRVLHQTKSGNKQAGNAVTTNVMSYYHVKDDDCVDVLNIGPQMDLFSE